MRINYLLTAAAMFVFTLTGLAATRSVGELSTQAASEDHSAAMTAIRELRSMGQVGLDALFVKYATEIEEFAKTGDATDEWKSIANALDTVAMQKDAYAAHLYWYTDIDQAKRIAKQKNKPILTLRLLGNLNEEFSCANSRLFRALLYSNSEVSKYLRDNYVLHWQSVRPAPRITIDFGDGRKIERTITGNSIHYIIDSDGQIIDALAGLYSPNAFLSYLKRSRAILNVTAKLSPIEKQKSLLAFRKENFDAIRKDRDSAVQSAEVTFTEPKNTTAALAVMERATSKAIVVDEVSLLRVYDDFSRFEPQINFEAWNKLAVVYSPTSGIDAASNAFIRRQNRNTGLTQAEFAGLFAKLDNFVALDTTRNDFLFHTKLYEWLNQRRPLSLDAFNAQVYEVLFKTPDSDKWLGLYSTDVYTALDGNGFVK
ncbi:MAG: hypothetical protein ACKVQW_01805 [Pyrinomonadaceae bacterium]